MLRTGQRVVAQHVDAPAKEQGSKEAEAVWNDLQTQPGFNERLAKAIHEMDRGLAVSYREVRRKRRQAISERRGGEIP